ncbi:hypothetical protein JCM14244_06820 [Venenivibrio stagnispumantis]|uniref:Uncharacterized protein n=1 Tax=Venenivibrio stagnispumantis TaxID=407998 RepID=A0AA46ACS8_9AQUI|nr:hypothetical protein [Venenivibrio stagnispumantis]MCW4572627.1 hypothetical protein [Venenivibrio stagnispumantis]SMP00668.1 hypothetical protein SAMN06264868_101142 [Venenivibrio stagnispumantis]
MKLDIEDFSFLLYKEEKKEEEKDKEKDFENQIKSLIQKYENQIKELVNQFNQEKENIYKTAFEEGYKKAENELKKQYEEKLNQLISEEREREKQEIEQINQFVKNFEEKLKMEYKEKIDKINQTIVDSINEIFQFLYLKDTDIEKIKHDIQEYIRSFENINYQLKVGKGLKILENYFEKVVIDENLQDFDFIIDFSDFKIESLAKDKLEVIKDEIEREIKKITED